MKKLRYILLLCIGIVTLASCSSSDGEDSSYAYYQWQVKNDIYFESIVARAKLQGKSNGWYIVKAYNKPDSTVTDSIVFHVLEQKKEPGHSETALKGDTVVSNVTKTLICPMFNDSVMVSYRGHLMPFDTSYEYWEKYNTYDGPDQEYVGKLFESHNYGSTNSIDDIEKYGTFVTDGVDVTDGFSTTLQFMHPGDRWRVFIPYNLAYGEDDSGTIPGGSTLIFDLYMKAFKINGEDEYIK